jgi:oligopeptide/dipeptide ABC transporter ATP-binding protein
MKTLLQIDGLKVHFPIGGGLFRRPQGYVHAVDDISVSLKPCEVVGLVGESGCGKTTVARAIMGLVEVTEGKILLDEKEISKVSGADRREYYLQVQMVFQDPFDSLNPRKTIFQTLAQPLRIHNIVPPSQVRMETAQLLDRVGLSPGQAFLDRYPHQFSGGQRQRICIARAIAVRPHLVLADEALSALDISIRAQVLNLMRQLQAELDLAYLFITHDLGVVRSLCDRVLVMYLGQVVEEGESEEIFTLPRHPYTVALLAASPPLPDPMKARNRQKIVLGGDVPSPVDPPAGCRFHPRCPVAEDICGREVPSILNVDGGHRSACHFADEAEMWSQKLIGQKEVHG